MKIAFLAFLAAIATLNAAPPSPQLVERAQKAAVQKYPALGQAGSPFNQRFIAIVTAKRNSEPAYFDQADWPLRAADAVAEELRKEEVAAKEKAKVDMERSEAERERTEKVTQQDREWDAEKARWVFDRLVFGDSEEVIVRKLNLSKIVASRAAPTMRVDLNSRYRWVLGESKFNMNFEMKDGGLAAIAFESLPERTTELDGLIQEDWKKLRTASIELFGPPTKSAEYPKTQKLNRGGMTVTDVWERPGRPAAIGLTEDGGRCNPTLRISDPSRGVTTPSL